MNGRLMKMSMNSKFVIFISLSTLLVAVIYSSSSDFGYIAYADTNTSCTGVSKTVSVCVVMDDHGNVSDWKCTYHKATKTWSCEAMRQTGGSTNVPPALKDALVKAQTDGATTGGDNNTSITNGNVVKNAGPLKGTDNNAPTNNTDVLH